jgi:hypothetical protein
MSAAPTIRRVARMDDFATLPDGLLTRTAGSLGQLPTDTFALATDLAVQTTRIDNLNNETETNFATLLQVIANGDQSNIDSINQEITDRTNADTALAGSKVDSNAIYATAATVAQTSTIQGEANPRWRRYADGKQEWGPGTGVIDTNLYRSAVSTLRTDNSFNVGAALTVATSVNLSGSGSYNARNQAGTGTSSFLTRTVADTVDRFSIDASGKHTWGDGTLTPDTDLFRAAANNLKTTSNFSALALTATGGNINLGQNGTSIVHFANAALGGTVIQSKVVGDTTTRFSISSDGKHNWGDGTLATDTDLFRISASRLGTTSVVRSTRTLSTSSSFEAQVAGDVNPRLQINADGKHQWGDGTLAQDTFLYRGGAGLLQHDGELRARTTGTAFATIRPTDTREPYNISPNGTHSWGDGTAVTDCALARVGVGILQVTNTRLRESASTASSVFLDAFVSGDSQPRYIANVDGTIAWGPGGTTATDTTLSRTAAGTLTLSGAGGLVLSAGNLTLGGATGTVISRQNTANANVNFVSRLSTDTVDKFSVSTDGTLSWGPGNAVQDTTLRRNAATSLLCASRFIIQRPATTDQALYVNLTSVDPNPRLLVNASGSLNWGDGTLAVDTVLQRQSAGVLELQNRLRVLNSVVSTAFSTVVSGDTSSRFAIDHAGTMVWGPGSAVTDTTFARTAVNMMDFGSTTQKVRLNIHESVAGDIALAVQIGAETAYRWRVLGDGKTQWSDGTTFDVTLYRSAADVLKTDDLFDATALALATKTKAGAPTDADWGAAPPIGTMVVDTTNNRLYVRTAAATWKSTLLA